VIALSVAATLAVFLLYTSLAGGSTPLLRPSQVASHSGTVSLAGVVLAPVRGNPHAGGLRFLLRDINGTETVPVVYTGSVPDLFAAGRDVSVRGEMKNGLFVAEKDSLVTKCPSKYAPDSNSKPS
jgi:cytochrome c-type biogenesis protein CcmE